MQRCIPYPVLGPPRPARHGQVVVVPFTVPAPPLAQATAQLAPGLEPEQWLTVQPVTGQVTAQFVLPPQSTLQLELCPHSTEQLTLWSHVTSTLPVEP